MKIVLPSGFEVDGWETMDSGEQLTAAAFAWQEHAAELFNSGHVSDSRAASDLSGQYLYLFDVTVQGPVLASRY